METHGGQLGVNSTPIVLAVLRESPFFSVSVVKSIHTANRFLLTPVAGLHAPGATPPPISGVGRPQAAATTATVSATPTWS